MNPCGLVIGALYGRLTLEGFEKRGRKLMAVCRCACGKTTYAEASPLANGRRTSCGCGTGGDRRSAKFRNRP